MQLSLRLPAVVELINASVPDCLVTNYEKPVNSIELPDPDDRHVVAAAIVGHADAIVTFNTKDFPQAILQPYRIEVQGFNWNLTLNASMPRKVLPSARRRGQYAHSIRIRKSMVQADVSTSRKRPVNLTLNEALVAQAKTYTNNLSATMEELLAQYVAVQQKAHANRRQLADACADEWNDFVSDHGSFADEYRTL